MSTTESETLPVLNDGELARLVGDGSNLPSLTARGGLVLDPTRDDHRSVLDELKEKLPFIDFENGGATIISVKIGDVSVRVEVTPTTSSVSLTLVGTF
jgi:hypothetical protein